ncbi:MULTISPECIES: hypothetical protein [Providencia]|uniref:hypothetical protein n=2 Tax=Providencia TaxID=586 RepID=UPI00141A34EC|nr:MULTISPECIES: hypothetical protein [Providencia]NIA43846.1 hypothetical protein [Providencia rettgeri]NIA97675.1 hypothetical protein [Providencia rettgeri]NIB15212.1 hypothetical protein [Providencia rettgeri]NIB35424.1 hypothetical protein [Providencia rettgeri]NIL71405.1 hypothetical protein [Providencia sp. 504mA]
MSSTKDYWYSMVINERANSRLADLLGISTDELDQLTYDIDSELSSDDFLYGYIVNFYGDNDPEILAKIDRLDSGSYVSLAPWELDDYDDEIEWDIGHPDQFEIVNKHLFTIKKILEIEIDKDIQFSLLVMLHTHIISAIEQFLSSTFIYHVTNSDSLTKKLIETDPEFGKRKFTMSEIYVQHNNIKSTVATYLKDIIYHDMRKIKPMFREVLSYDFGDVSWLFDAIKKRHDCAHRAGYDKEGKPVLITVDSINELVENCKDLASAVDKHIQSYDSLIKQF